MPLRTIKPTMENTHDSTIATSTEAVSTQQFYSQTESMATTESSQNHVTPDTENSQTSVTATFRDPDSHQPSFTTSTDTAYTQTTESQTQSDATPIKSTFTLPPGDATRSVNDAVTSHATSPHHREASESYALERNTSSKRPVTLRLTVTNTSDITQLLFSGGPHTDPETSTSISGSGTILTFLTDPNVTMMDGPGLPSDPIVHSSTDPDSQTTFTAVTTTERQQEIGGAHG